MKRALAHRATLRGSRMGWKRAEASRQQCFDGLTRHGPGLVPRLRRSPSACLVGGTARAVFDAHGRASYARSAFALSEPARRALARGPVVRSSAEAEASEAS